jgi:FKBP-type peptidyl-prolyl cis-trans isomerase (trigger factor)
MDIEITPKKSDGLERLIEVRVPVETVRDAENKAAQRYASSVRLPGFRPRQGPSGHGEETLQGCDPAGSDRVARPRGVQRGHGP